MKTEQQIKDRLTDIDNTLALSDPDYPDDRIETDNADVVYMRGYAAALTFVLNDLVIIARL